MKQCKNIMILNKLNPHFNNKHKVRVYLPLQI